MSILDFLQNKKFQYKKKIELFILFLHQIDEKIYNSQGLENKINLQDERGNTIHYTEIKKVISSFFMDLFNGESEKDTIDNYNNFREHKEKEKIHIPIINFNLQINIKDINFEIKLNLHNNNTTIFTITYTIDKEKDEKKIILKKDINKKIYEKIKSENNIIVGSLIFLYSIIGFDTGNFLGIHPDLYKYITDNFSTKNTLECFASPFNNNLSSFFSLFYPVDKFYGSEGDFFEHFLKRKDKANNVYIINPPFTEKIIARVMDMIVKKLNDETIPVIHILFYIPMWKSILNWYQEQIKEIFSSNLCILNKKKSIIYDYINEETKIAKFGTYLIYISNMNKMPCKIMSKI